MYNFDYYKMPHVFGKNFCGFHAEGYFYFGYESLATNSHWGYIYKSDWTDMVNYHKRFGYYYLPYSE